jgi:hypothetical protein
MVYFQIMLYKFESKLNQFLSIFIGLIIDKNSLVLTYFKKLYQNREKWCRSFSSTVMDLHIMSTQRGESCNAMLKRLNVNRKSTLEDLYCIIQKLMVKNCEERREYEIFKNSKNKYVGNNLVPLYLKNMTLILTEYAMNQIVNNITICRGKDYEIEKIISSVS